MLILDTCFRLLAAGQLLVIAFVIGRSVPPRPIRFTTVVLLLCVAAYLANVAPVVDMPHSPLWPVIELASQSTPLALWLSRTGSSRGRSIGGSWRAPPSRP